MFALKLYILCTLCGTVLFLLVQFLSRNVRKSQSHARLNKIRLCQDKLSNTIFLPSLWGVLHFRISDYCPRHLIFKRKVETHSESQNELFVMLYCCFWLITQASSLMVLAILSIWSRYCFSTHLNVQSLRLLLSFSVLGDYACLEKYHNVEVDGKRTVRYVLAKCRKMKITREQVLDHWSKF